MRPIGRRGRARGWPAPPIALLLLTCLALAACSAPSESIDVAASNSDATEDLAHQDTHADSSATTNDADTDPGAPSLQLGVNEVFKHEPASFKTLDELGEAPVELGIQGLYMVVLAFRERGIIDGPYDLTATCTQEGKVIGNAKLNRQKAKPGGDGWSYQYDIFLVLDGSGYLGKPGTFTVEIRTESPPELTFSETAVLVSKF